MKKKVQVPQNVMNVDTLVIQAYDHLSEVQIIVGDLRRGLKQAVAELQKYKQKEEKK